MAPGISHPFRALLRRDTYLLHRGARALAIMGADRRADAHFGRPCRPAIPLHQARVQEKGQLIRPEASNVTTYSTTLYAKCFRQIRLKHLLYHLDNQPLPFDARNRFRLRHRRPARFRAISVLGISVQIGLGTDWRGHVYAIIPELRVKRSSRHLS